MGISASKRVSNTFTNSSDFNAICNSTYDHFTVIRGGSNPGILPYQLFDAATQLHESLFHLFPIIKRWAPFSPTQIQVDHAYRAMARDEAQDALGREEFKAFVIELLSKMIISSVKGELVARVPIGVAGIAGIGLVTKVNKNLVVSTIGVYALGVATWIYIGLA